MASLYPSEAMGIPGGRIAAGQAANFVHLDDDLTVRGTLIGGVTAFS